MHFGEAPAMAMKLYLTRCYAGRGRKHRPAITILPASFLLLSAADRNSGRPAIFFRPLAGKMRDKWRHPVYDSTSARQQMDHLIEAERGQCKS